MTQRTYNFQLGGGLDLKTSPALIKPGRVLAANNYEPDDEGGYRRISGYERFDGLPSPSEATYHILNYTNQSAAFAVDDVVDGDPSAASGLVLADTVVATNLLTRSEEFDHADWTGFQTGTTLTPDDIVAPDGTTTADKFDNTNGNPVNWANGSIAPTVGQRYTLSVFVKETSQSMVIIRFGDNVWGTLSLGKFVWVGGVPVFDPTFASVSGAILGDGTGAVSDEGGGWYRISLYTPAIDDRVPPIGNMSFDLYPGGYSPTDIGVTHLWGAQFEVGPLTDYIRSVATAGNRGYLALSEVTGVFVDGEDLDVSATKRAEAIGTAGERDAPTDALDETYRRAAIEARRANIAAVPGSGSVQGVWVYNGLVYAVRNNAGATAAVMHVSSASGWTVVDLGQYVDFSVGAVESFVEGEQLTFTGSGATADLVAVGITSGSFSGGDAAGRLYIKNVAGGTIAGTDTITGDTSSATADCDSAETAVALPIGGKYEFYNYNFGGSVGTYSMWGVNGVGRGFRFDGTDFAFIHVTGLSDSVDKPQHLVAHKKHLFFSINSSVQHSSTGLPMEWSAITGASELSTGDLVTGMQDQPGGTLAIFNRNRTYILYGNDINDWDLTDYNLEKGAIEWSIQDAGISIYVDDRGVSILGQTDKFGDFQLNTISELVDPLVQAKKRLIENSVRLRSKDQYRVFFSDGSGLILRVDNNPQHRQGQRYEFMPFQYTASVESVCAEEDANGFERMFFGSDDGFVYEAEKGDSFDGSIIKFFLRLAFCHCSTPRQQKRFHKATFQVDAPDPTDISFSPEFSYGKALGTTELPVAQFATAGGVWDLEDDWGEFVWDGQLVGEAEAYIQGVGINASLLILGESNFERAHTWKSMTYNFSMRGLRR